MRRTLRLVLIAGFWHLWDGRNGDAYNTWSGWLADLALVTLITAFAASVATWLRKHNCHVHGCWRLSWHPHPDHGHPVCAVHHPIGHRGLLWRLTHSRKHSAVHVLSGAEHRYDHHRSRG